METKFNGFFSYQKSIIMINKRVFMNVAGKHGHFIQAQMCSNFWRYKPDNYRILDKSVNIITTDGRAGTLHRQTIEITALTM